MSSELCLDAGSVMTCQDPPLINYPMCNWTLPVEERVADLLNRMVWNIGRYWTDGWIMCAIDIGGTNKSDAIICSNNSKTGNTTL